MNIFPPLESIIKQLGLGSDGQSLLERGQEMISNGKAVITSLNEAANLNSAGIEGLQFGKYIKNNMIQHSKKILPKYYLQTYFIS